MPIELLRGAPRRARRDFSRLRLLLAILLTLALARTSSWAQSSAAGSGPDPVVRVDSVALTVSDMGRALDFYTGVLGFVKTDDRELSGAGLAQVLGVPGARVRAVRLALGTEHLELLEFIGAPGRSLPPDSRSNDRWFQHVAIVVRDMDSAYARLQQSGVRPASVAPQRLPDWNPNAGGIRAFYFKDPDEHILEVIQFPPGKGLPRWQAPSSALFLGIDHTAIVVSDTPGALRYYRDRLGLHVVGSSENYGIEQERLNNVTGAHLRITSLRGASGPGVEFLEYLAPRTGRPAPLDSRANDLWYWQVDLAVSDPARTRQQLQARHAPASPLLAVPGAEVSFGSHEAFTARDADGHATWIGRAAP